MVNPAIIDFTQNSVANAWVIDAGTYLPFGGQALAVDALVPNGGVRNSNNVRQYVMPYVDTAQGGARTQVQVVWPTAVRGKVQATIRMDSR